MLELLVKGDNFPIAATFATVIVAIIVVGSCLAVVSVVRILSRDRLKHLMIERGMSPEEIKQVLEADCEVWPHRRRRRELRSESKHEPNWR
jgi:hypothetical protein